MLVFIKRVFNILYLIFSLTFGSFGIGWSGDFQKG